MKKSRQQLPIDILPCDPCAQAEFNLKIGEAIADRGYGDALGGLETRGIKTNIPLWSTRTGQSLFRDLDFGFSVNADGKGVTCPAGHQMRRRGHDNTHKRIKHHMLSKTCSNCPLASQCLHGKEKITFSKTFYISDQIWAVYFQPYQNPTKF